MKCGNPSESITLSRVFSSMRSFLLLPPYEETRLPNVLDELWFRKSPSGSLDSSGLSFLAKAEVPGRANEQHRTKG